MSAVANPIVLEFSVTDIDISCPKSIESQAEMGVWVHCKTLMLSSEQDSVAANEILSQNCQLAPQTAKLLGAAWKNTIVSIGDASATGWKFVLSSVSLGLAGKS